MVFSIARSVYPNLECFGNGLLYAYEPWSGHYEADKQGVVQVDQKNVIVRSKNLRAGYGAGL
jgi:hypothetical protein